jgi:hypothetical protein
MKVKIKDNIFDSEVEPIMLIFDTDNERITTGQNISNMKPMDTIRKYCSYPKDIDKLKITEFIKL